MRPLHLGTHTQVRHPLSHTQQQDLNIDPGVFVFLVKGVDARVVARGNGPAEVNLSRGLLI